LESLDPLLQAQLERVVVRVADGDEVAIARKGAAKGSARAVDGPPADRMIDPLFQARSAGDPVSDLTWLTDAQTQSWIARIRFERCKQVMSLRPDITDIQQRVMRELPLNRELIFLGVGQNIFVVERGRSSNGEKVRPVDGSSGRGEGNGEALPFDVAGGAVNKWRDEFRRHRAAVESSKWSIADFVEICRPFKRCVELAPPGANTALPGTSG